MRGAGIPRLIVVALAAVLAACSGPTGSTAPTASAPPAAPSPSPIAAAPTEQPSTGPSLTPVPTSVAEPSPTASTYVSFAEFPYVDHFVMRVAVDDLNVRRKPDKSGISEGKAEKGELFMIYDWPISADGYTWYYGYEQLQNKNTVPSLPQPYNDGYDEVLGGWMAAGTEDTPFLVPVGPRCPAVRDLRNISAMLGSERVACFGTDALTFEGTFGCGGCGGEAPGTFEPAWLASPLEFFGLSNDVIEGPPLSLHFAPEGPAVPAEEAVIRVHGHFADSRSSTCRITNLADDGTLTLLIANKAAEAWCRTKFVVDSYEVIG